MTKQEILAMLADVECEIFHLSTDNPDDDDLRKARIAAREALEAFAASLGIKHERTPLY